MQVYHPKQIEIMLTSLLDFCYQVWCLRPISSLYHLAQHDLKQEMHGPVMLVEDVAGTATASAKSSTVLKTILLQDAHEKRKDQRKMRDVVRLTFVDTSQDGKRFPSGQ